ncbi:hypothetical protein AB6N23_17215, partial [Cellulomonas sp. 179-A 9B4 NHS]
MTHGTERGTTAGGATDDRDEPGARTDAPDGARGAEPAGVPAPRVPSAPEGSSSGAAPRTDAAPATDHAASTGSAPGGGAAPATPAPPG